LIVYNEFLRSKDASVTASDRLLKELRAVYKSEVVKQGKMTVEPIEDNIYELKVVWVTTPRFTLKVTVCYSSSSILTQLLRRTSQNWQKKRERK